MGQDRFIVDAFNEEFVTGETQRPPDHLIGVVFAVVVLFIVPMIGLNLVVYEAWRTADGFSPSLALVTLVMLMVNGILLGATWWFWRRYSLRNTGQLIDGEVVKASGEIRPGPQGNDFVITVMYQFSSPRNDKAIKGTIAQVRNDLVEAPLPASGTPVAVLYRNDRNYRVM
jgi:hypothetical protein